MALVGESMTVKLRIAAALMMILYVGFLITCVLKYPHETNIAWWTGAAVTLYWRWKSFQSSDIDNVTFTWRFVSSFLWWIAPVFLIIGWMETRISDEYRRAH